MTSSWFFLSTLNYDARSTTHQIYDKILTFLYELYSVYTLHKFYILQLSLNCKYVTVKIEKTITRVHFIHFVFSLLYIAPKALLRQRPSYKFSVVVDIFR